ncbi:type II toxin-antitoxin system VapC family toxin [Labrys sp. KB_33_2]|uniref:type II toxin-antitoxin system VapC family toxin n=1 Tax=Labrys sp. KB_33_2 TaxID=3237479 RepID=UPI003F92407D
MLDTNIVSDLIRHPDGKAARHIAGIGDHGLAVSIITACELRFGAVKRGSGRLQERVEAILQRLTILAFDVPADGKYADIRAALERAGTPIGPNDLLIAAHASAAGIPLVTANIDEFARIPHLVLENWLA